MLPGHSQGVIDKWKVRCADKLVTVHSDVSRHRALCAPAGFELIPRRAKQAFDDAGKLLEQQQWPTAYRRVKQALELGGRVDQFLHRKAIALLMMHRFVAAVAAFDAALEISPSDPELRLHRAIAVLKQGKRAEYARIVKRLHSELPEGHRLRPELACRQAIIYHGQGRTSAGKPLARDACRKGVTACCRYPAKKQRSP